MFKRSIPPLVPVVSTLLIPEMVHAQSQQQPTTPQTAPVSIDPLTAAGYFLVIVVSGFAILPKVLGKYLDQLVDQKQKKTQQKLDEERTMADVFISRTDKSAQAIDEILKLSLTNNFDNLRQQIEINYEYQKIIGSLEDSIKQLAERIYRQEGELESIAMQIKDIVNVLNMKERAK